jgi:hypothetical protein
MSHDPDCKNKTCTGCGPDCDKARLVEAKRLLRWYVHVYKDNYLAPDLLRDAKRFLGMKP